MTLIVRCEICGRERTGKNHHKPFEICINCGARGREIHKRVKYVSEYIHRLSALLGGIRKYIMLSDMIEIEGQIKQLEEEFESMANELMVMEFSRKTQTKMLKVAS